MLIWILLWIPLAIFLNGVVLLAIIRQMKKELRKSESESYEVPLEFIVLGESSDSYEVFLSLTYKLEEVRKTLKKEEVTSDVYKERVKELDDKILSIQEFLIHVNTDGIPNPDMLTKRYIQELILRILLIRIHFEKIHGRSFDEDSDDAKVLKFCSSKK